MEHEMLGEGAQEGEEEDVADDGPALGWGGNIVEGASPPEDAGGEGLEAAAGQAKQFGGAHRADVLFVFGKPEIDVNEAVRVLLKRLLNKVSDHDALPVSGGRGLGQNQDAGGAGHGDTSSRDEGVLSISPAGAGSGWFCD